MSKIRLIIQGDDFGVCHSVNRAIAELFEAGMVTQASIMAPCPWFWEAASLAAKLGIPVGVHCTLTSEWDHLRWRPLTEGASLVEPDGTMYRSVEAAVEGVDAAEGRIELDRQVMHLMDAGLAPLYLDCHMGPVSVEAFEGTCERFDLPFLYPIGPCALRFESIAMLSPMDRSQKTPWLESHLSALSPGAHLLVTHPGLPGPELAGLAPGEAENFPWAEEYRASDFETLMDPAIRSRIDELGIELISVGDL